MAYHPTFISRIPSLRHIDGKERFEREQKNQDSVIIKGNNNCFYSAMHDVWIRCTL